MRDTLRTVAIVLAALITGGALAATLLGCEPAPYEPTPQPGPPITAPGGTR